MTNENQRLRATISGRVQGVNFRYYTQQTARRLHLTGWVRNTDDRKVEVIAEGQREALESLLEFLHEGPPAARVTYVNATWHPATGEFVSFEITF